MNNLKDILFGRKFYFVIIEPFDFYNGKIGIQLDVTTFFHCLNSFLVALLLYPLIGIFGLIFPIIIYFLREFEDWKKSDQGADILDWLASCVGVGLYILLF